MEKKSEVLIEISCVGIASSLNNGSMSVNRTQTVIQHMDRTRQIAQQNRMFYVSEIDNFQRMQNVIGREDLNISQPWSSA